MKFIKLKSLLISCAVCLLPVLLGVCLWNRLPSEIATHFNFHGEPDGFSPKAFAVFGPPVIMMFFQAVCCIAVDFKPEKYSRQRIIKLILPFLCIALQTVIFGYAMGYDIDMRKTAIIIIGVTLVITLYGIKAKKS